MVADGGLSGLGMEYFCFEHDGMWSWSDRDLLDMGRRELVALGICRADEVKAGMVYRQPKAYPVYDGAYLACGRRARVAAASPAESVADWAERHASLQQPGPLDDDGDPGGAEYRDGGALRSVAGEHRRRESGRGAGGGGRRPAGAGADREVRAVSLRGE